MARVVDIAGLFVNKPGDSFHHDSFIRNCVCLCVNTKPTNNLAIVSILKYCKVGNSTLQLETKKKTAFSE